MKFVMLAVVLGLTQVAAAQNADDYRGGWRTDRGEAHTYEFSIRGTTVRGIYCTYCADATTLAFVDGTFGPDGITFEVTHVKADGSTAYKDKAIAKFSDGTSDRDRHERRPAAARSSASSSRIRGDRIRFRSIVSVLPKAPPVPAGNHTREPGRRIACLTFSRVRGNRS